MSVAELLQRLDQRFRILTGGSRTAPRRQQTLRALIDWSYDLLTDAEKALLPRLSVFAGGWTLEAAEGVCSGEGIEAWEMLDLLTSLADKSLLSTEVRHGAARYGMLESVRQYARELLHAQPSATEWIQCHLSYFVLLGEEVEPQLNGPRPEASFARLDLEHGNLRAALTPNDGMAGEGARLRLQLASALWRFWSQRGHFSEGRHWLEAALTAAPDDGSAHRARALRGAGFLMYRQGDNGAAQACFERSLAISRALDDRPAIAAALCNMGKAARGLGNYAVARAQIEEALTIAREHSADVALVMMLCDLSLVEMDQGKLAVAQALLAEGLGISRSLDCPNGIALTLLNLGVAHLLNADLVVARQYLEESLDQYRKLGDPYFIAVALRNLAATVADLGDQAAACGYHAECLALAQRLGDRTGAACTLLSMGELTWQAGAPATALNLVQQGLTMLIELGDRRFIADAFEQIGYIALALSDPRKAARMWGWSDGLRQEIGAPLPACGRALYDERVTAARASISDDAIFDRLFQDGRQMTQVQAVEYALTVAPV
jgi:non-specific serine/threonine protein kinase